MSLIMGCGWWSLIQASVVALYALHRTMMQIWFLHLALCSLLLAESKKFSILEFTSCSKELGIYFMACTRLKIVVEPAALDNEQLQNQLEKIGVMQT